MEEIKPSRFRITAADRFEESVKISFASVTKEVFVLKLFDFLNSPDNKNFVNYKFTSCMIKIITDAVFSMPEMNVRWKPRADKLEPKIIKYTDLSLGIALETIAGKEPCSAVATVNEKIKDGYSDLWRMNLHQIDRCVRELTARARIGRLTADDFEPSPNIVLNNLGTFENIDSGVPLPPPFASLMISTFRARVKQIYNEKNYESSLRRMMPVTLSFDHRLFDGPKINKFMGVLKDKIENPHF